MGFALDRVASRIRFGHSFTGSVQELMEHQDAIEAGFIEFFPELIQHINQLRLEQPSPLFGNQTYGTNTYCC